MGGSSFGAPSIGGGGTGRRAGGSSMPRITYFKWTEVRIGKIQAVTPKEGEKAPGPISDEDHIKQALGFKGAKLINDKRPVLVYFHWPHEDKKHGKLTTTFCSRVMDDEVAARWSQLFRCVQIDMGDTEEKFAKLIGDSGKPGLVALDQDLKVKARIPAVKSGTKLRKALIKAHDAFPASKKELKKTLAQHDKWMAEAKKLEKKKEYDAAVDVIDKIRFSKVRVGPDYDKAYAYGMKLALKAEQQGNK